MRALVISFMHPDIVPGGAQQVAYNLHLGLQQAGHQSFFTAFHDRLPARLVSDSTPIVKMPQRDNEYIVNVTAFDYDRFISCNRWVLEAYIRFAKGIDPNVIFVHHFVLTGIDFLVALRKAFPKARFIFTAHEFLPICKRDGHLVRANGQLCSSFTPFDCIGCFPNAEPKDFSVRFRMFQRLFDVCDVVVTPSLFQGQIMAQHFAFGDRLAVVPNGSFEDVSHAFNGIDRRPRGETMAFFGQVLRDKGIGFLLHQIPSLLASRKQLKIEIWGGGLNLNRPDFQQKVAQAVKLIGDNFGKDRLVLRGNYDNRRVIEIMSLYDCVLFPSLWPETFSMVFSEAVIAGCKIVAPSLGAFKERSAEAGANAYLYKLGDALSFSVAVNAALSSPYSPLSPTAGENLTIAAMTESYLAAALARASDVGTELVHSDLADIGDFGLADFNQSDLPDGTDDDEDEPMTMLVGDNEAPIDFGGEDILEPEQLLELTSPMAADGSTASLWQAAPDATTGSNPFDDTIGVAPDNGIDDLAGLDRMSKVEEPVPEPPKKRRRFGF
jgi:glycosyltransferase involved in cell wall biosynthesis